MLSLYSELFFRYFPPYICEISDDDYEDILEEKMTIIRELTNMVLPNGIENKWFILGDTIASSYTGGDATDQMEAFIYLIEHYCKPMDICISGKILALEGVKIQYYILNDNSIEQPENYTEKHQALIEKSEFDIFQIIEAATHFDEILSWKKIYLDLAEKYYTRVANITGFILSERWLSVPVFLESIRRGEKICSFKYETGWHSNEVCGSEYILDETVEPKKWRCSEHQYFESPTNIVGL
jgi:hypothetical protein